MEISVVIPAYNEGRRLGPYLRSLLDYLRERYPHDHEVLVVDDGSTDDTAQAAAELIGRGSVIRFLSNQGKGAAVRVGMRLACGRLRLFTDADGATPIAELERLLQRISRGADVAIGSRAARGGQRRLVVSGEWSGEIPGCDDPPLWHVRLHRHLAGRVFSTLVFLLTGLRVLDTQCGFKLFRAAAAEALFARSCVSGFAFDVEVLLLARRLQLKVVEVPVTWREVEGSKVRLFTDAIRMARDVIRARWSQRSEEADRRLAPSGQIA